MTAPLTERAADDVCLSVRVPREHADAMREWCAARGISIQMALQRAVRVFVEWGPVDDERRAGRS